MKGVGPKGLQADKFPWNAPWEQGLRAEKWEVIFYEP